MVLRLPAAVCPGSPEPQPGITMPHTELADFEAVNSVTLEGAGVAPSYLSFWLGQCTSLRLAGAMRAPGSSADGGGQEMSDDQSLTPQ